MSLNTGKMKQYNTTQQYNRLSIVRKKYGYTENAWISEGWNYGKKFRKFKIIVINSEEKPWDLRFPNSVNLSSSRFDSSFCFELYLCHSAIPVSQFEYSKMRVR